MTMLCAYAAGDPTGVRSAAEAFVRAAPADFPGRPFALPWVAWCEGVVPPSWERLPVPGEVPRSTDADRMWAGSSFAVVRAYAGLLEEARRDLDVALDATRSALLPQHQAMVVAAEAAVAVAEGREDEAIDRLAGFVSRVDVASVERTMRNALAVGVVLCDELRRRWEEVDPGPLHHPALRWGQAVAAAREGAAPPSVELPPAGRAATAVPLRWAVELACRWQAAEPRWAREVLEVLSGAHGERARAALRAAVDAGERAVATGAKRLRGSVAFGTAPVELRVLGPTELVVGGRVCDAEDWRRERVRALASLLAHRRQVRREEAADALWPEMDLEGSRRNLRVTLSYLQRLLEPERLSSEPAFYLRQSDEWLRLLDEPHVVIDAELFERQVAAADELRASGQLEGALDRYRAAARLWRGPYLEEVATQEWAVRAADRARARATAARLAHATVELALGDAAAAAHTALSALEIDPWSEAAFRTAMSAQLALGDRGAARRTLAACDELLADLGITASAETEALRRRIEGG